MTKRIEVAEVPAIVGTMYPPPYDQPCRSRERRKLGDAAGLTQFGVNYTRLAPGGWSNQRHWHTREDEFVYVVSGELVLVTDDGEEILRAGDAVGFKAGEPNGHCLQNRSERDACILEVGTRDAQDAAAYPDIDLAAPPKGSAAMYTHRDGTPYTGLRRRGPGD